MHRGGGVAGSGAGGAAGIGGGSGGSGALPSTSHRGLELEHPSAMPGAPGFHWGAMLAGHHAAAAASMMQPPLSAAAEYTPAPAHHGPTHPAMPMDLHVHQGFPYYRFVPSFVPRISISPRLIVRRFPSRVITMHFPPNDRLRQRFGKGL